jgi:tetratricopeptide (TPR) repeat protein
MQLNPDVKFCKKCGTPVTTTGVPTEPIRETQPYQPYQTQQPNQPYQPYPPQQPYQIAPAYEPVPAVSQARAVNKRALWIGIAVGLAILAAGYYWYSHVGVERKLEDAISKGNLIKPPGESALDYYRKLKQSGMSEGARKRLEARLLPTITARPQQMIAEIASPGNRPETTLADWQDAQTLMEWAVEMQLQDNALAARSSYCAGRIANLSNRKDEAITYWKRAADQDATWALPLNGIGLIYNERRNYQTARSFFFEAIRREPQFALPYNNIGTSFFYEKDDAQAENYYRQAIERAPQWPRPHAWLGEIAMRRKDYNAAAQEYEAVINLDPSGTSGIEVDKIRQQLERARQLAQQANVVQSEIWLSANNTEARIQLHPDRWSEKVIPPSGYRFFFNGPPGAMVQFADGTEGSIHRNYGDNSEWLKGFRFKGPEGGEVVVRIVAQR